MKVFLALGSEEIEDVIRECDFEIVDSDDNLISLIDLIEYITIDAIVVNRFLDEDGEMLLKLANKAQKKGIKLIGLIEEFEDYEERKLITNLVNLGVTAFLRFDEVTKESVEEAVNNYPEEFDFSLFSEPKLKVIEKIESVFKKVITLYSPTSEGTSRVSAHLAYVLAEQGFKTLIIDFNPLKPIQRELFNLKRTEYTLSDALDAVVKRSLSNVVLESYVTNSKAHRNLDILCGIYDLNDVYNVNRRSDFEEIIEKAQISYDYLVIDTHSWYDTFSTDRALYLADEIIVPVRGRRSSIDTVNRYLENFNRYNDFDIRKFNIVINKYSGEDLTSIEIESYFKNPVIGYISENKGYDKANVFKNIKLMNEYVPILKSLGIKAKKRKKPFSIGLFKKNKGKKKPRGVSHTCL